MNKEKFAIVPFPNSIVAGTAQYKNEMYYLAGKMETVGSDRRSILTLLTSKDTMKYILYSKNGRSQIKAPCKHVIITKHFEQPKTLKELTYV